jgi:hypothetical protein
VAICSKMPWISPAGVRDRESQEGETLAVEGIHASDESIGAGMRAIERQESHEDP